MAKLELNFLGSYAVSHDNLKLTGFESNKVRALLCYLAIESDRPHARETLAGLFWPDWPNSSARSNLRYALADLRKTIHDQQADPPFLLITRNTIQFNPQCDHSLDVDEFNGLASIPEGAGVDGIEHLEQAFELYKGEFLDGFSVPEAAPFEEWARLKREQLHRQYLGVLHDMAAAYERNGGVSQALPYAWRGVELEPWHEQAQRQLMRLLALDGQRSTALAQYEACRRVLAQELDVEPSLETTQLYENIRDGILDLQTGTPTLIEELPPAPGLPPFLGLQYFDEADADLYFGRETLIARLAGQLRELPGGRFLAVVGASGSGKSSLVRAGLIPALRKGESLSDGSNPPRWSHRWLIHMITPTAHPLEALATSLTREGGSVSPTAALIDDMGKDPRSLHLYARRMTHLKRAPHLLLVVDQFEELFTLCRSERERSAFIENLLVAAGIEAKDENSPGESNLEEPVNLRSGQDGPLIALIALRADFYDHCSQYARLRSALSIRQEYIGAMAPDELRRAIEEPARRNEWEFEPGLVGLILREVSSEPGALPLLSHALLETWRRRRGRTLTLKGYAEAGGIHRAIAQTAESVYNRLPDGKQTLARRIFLRLTELGEGTQDTRRRASLSELVSSPEAAPLVESVLNTLVEARLVTAGEGTVEVAHEALIREWPALRSWLEQDREGLRLQRHLTEAAQDWNAMQRDPGELYRGARLAQALEWAAIPENLEALNPLERDFLNASRELEEREIADREAQRQRELEAAQQRAEEQAQASARLRRRALYLVGALILALVMAGTAFAFANRSADLAVQNANNANLAENQRATAVAALGQAESLASQRSRDAQVNQSLALAAQSQLVLQSGNQELALALAMEANSIPNPPGKAQLALSEAAYAPGTVRVFLGHQAPVESVAVSPDGRYGLSGDDNGEIFLWDLETGIALRRLDGHADMVTSLAFTPDGRHAVSASLDKTLIYWDLEKSEEINQFTGHQDGVNTVAISPDGRLAASGSGRLFSWYPYSSEDNSLRLWDLNSGKEIQRFELFSDSVTDVSFTPDGSHLAVATMSDGFMLLDIQTGKALIRASRFSYLTKVAVSLDGQFTLEAADGGNIWMRDLRTGDVAKQLGGHNSGVWGLAVSPNGERALTGSLVVIEYDLATGEQLNQFNFGANDIAYLPDGRTALIGSQDTTLRLLALDSGAEIGRLPVGFDRYRGIAYNSQAQTLVANDTEHLSAWDLATNENLWKVKAETAFWDVAMSPDGMKILASGLGGFVGLFDTSSGEMLNILNDDGYEGHPTTSWVDAVAFHPSGKFALSGSQGEGNNLIYWDLDTGKQVWRFDTKGTAVLGIAISPNGLTALSAEINGRLEWWDLETGRLIKDLEGHTNAAWSVAFIDDHTAISASEDSSMILWDLESGTALHSFLGHSAGIKRVALSPDRRLAVSASRDNTMILWDIQSGEPLRRYLGHTNELTNAAWSSDGREVMSGGVDQQAIRWRIDTDLEGFLKWVQQNRYIRPLTCSERDAYNILPLCQNESQIAGSESASPARPSTRSLTALLPPIPALASVTSTLSLSPVLTERAGETVWGMNLGDLPLGGKQIWEYSGNAGDRLSIRVSAEQPVNKVWGFDRQIENGLFDPTLSVYSPDGELLAQSDDLENGLATDAYLASLTLPQTGSYQIEVAGFLNRTGGRYRLVIADPRRLAFSTNLGATAGLAVHPDGRRVLVGSGQSCWDFDPVSGDHSVWVWDVISGEVVQKLAGHENTVCALAVSPDGRQVLSGDSSGIAILWDLESGKEIRRLDNRGVHFKNIIFNPDGQTALSTSYDVNPVLWDLASGQVIRRYEGHTNWTNNLVVSPGGQTFYSTADDNTVRAWNAATGELIATFQPFEDVFSNGLAISPDGSRLLVGRAFLEFESIEGRDGVIALLDAKTGANLQNLEGHTASVVSIAFSPDGRYALSGSWDRTVRLWEVNAGKQLAVFAGHSGFVWNVAFSPDGLTGYSTSEDGSLRVWDLSEYID